MPKSSLRFRIAVIAVLLATAGAGVAVARWAALPWALGAALRAGGATEVSFDLTRASPWRLQVDDLAFNLPALRVAAERASIERRHWWSPSLGRLKVETARVDMHLDRLASGQPAPISATPASPPPGVPLEEISIDGRITLHAGGEPARALTVNFAARPDGAGRWRGEAKATAPGLELAVEATYGLDEQKADFRTTMLRLDLQSWQAWLEHWAPLPGGPWELSGTLTGSAEGHYAADDFSARGEFHLRDARIANTGLGFVAEGVEADIGSADLGLAQATDIAVRAQTVTSGKLVVADIAARIAHAESARLEIASISARALGGALHVEPFVYRPEDAVVDVVVRAEGIRAEEVMALTQDLPARASGPLSGRLPLRYEDGSLRLGTGWLGLESGSSLEIQFQTEGLLTAGTSPKSPNYAVLKQVEDGLLKLKVTELRLDVRPPDSPANRTARLHLVGAPVDPQIKAPVTLDLNVNGPIESLLNLGLKTRAGGGTKP